jgi:hypothetical protein
MQGQSCNTVCMGIGGTCNACRTKCRQHGNHDRILERERERERVSVREEGRCLMGSPKSRLAAENLSISINDLGFLDPFSLLHGAA